MRTLNRKLIRSIRGSCLLLLAISSIMAVGIACYVGLASGYKNLLTAKRDYYAQCRMADFTIELNKLPVPELRALEPVPGVAELRPRIKSYATVDLEEMPESVNGLVLSLPDEPAPIINNILIRRGEYFTDDRGNEVIVNESFAQQHNLAPGDAIHLTFNGQRRRLVVVGTAISSEFVYLVDRGSFNPDPEHFGAFYLKQSYLEEVLDFGGACNELLGMLAPASRDSVEPILDELESRLDTYGVITTTPLADQPSNRFVTDDIYGLGIFATLLPSLFLGTAAIVLNVLMMRLVERERTTIGTLKGLGYDDWQLFWYYMRLGIVVAVFGGLLGCFGGYQLAQFLTRNFDRFFEFPKLLNQVNIDVYLTGVLIGLVCAVAGTLRGAYSVLRLDAAEAMRPKSPSIGQYIVLERFQSLWRSLSSATRMVLRGIFRNWVRSLTGLFATAMGTGLLVCAFIVDESMMHLVNFQYRLVQRSDVDLRFEDARSGRAFDEARRLPGVDYAEPVLELACTFTNGAYRKRGSIVGLVADARLTVPHDERGRPVKIPEAGLVMTEKLAEVLHVSPGDVITVKTIKGSQRPHRVRVVKTVKSYLGLPVYANLDFLRRLVDEEVAISGAQLETDVRPESMLTLHRELKRLPVLESVIARSDRIENIINTLIATLQLETRVLIVFAAVAYFASVVNSSLISLAEREREIATLSALGYTQWQIGNLFLREIAFVNTTGMLFGLPIGYLLAWFVIELHDTELYRVPLACPASVWILACLLSLLFSLVAHAVVQRTINRTEWLELVKVKE